MTSFAVLSVARTAKYGSMGPTALEALDELVRGIRADLADLGDNQGALRIQIEVVYTEVGVEAFDAQATVEY